MSVRFGLRFPRSSKDLARTASNLPPAFFSVFCVPEQLAGFSTKLSPSGPFGTTIQNVKHSQLKQRWDPGVPAVWSLTKILQQPKNPLFLVR